MQALLPLYFISAAVVVVVAFPLLCIIVARYEENLQPDPDLVGKVYAVVETYFHSNSNFACDRQK